MIFIYIHRFPRGTVFSSASMVIWRNYTFKRAHLEDYEEIWEGGGAVGGGGVGQNSFCTHFLHQTPTGRAVGIFTASHPASPPVGVDLPIGRWMEEMKGKGSCHTAR